MNNNNIYVYNIYNIYILEYKFETSFGILNKFILNHILLSKYSVLSIQI